MQALSGRHGEAAAQLQALSSELSAAKASLAGAEGRAQVLAMQLAEVQKSVGILRGHRSSAGRLV